MSPDDLIDDRAAVQAPSSLKAGREAFQRIDKVFINQQSGTTWTAHHPTLLKERAEGLAEESASPA